MTCSLAAVPLGKEAELNRILLDAPMRDRMYDLGLTPGCRIRCIYAAGSGDPRAYLVRGTVLAIRNRDAAGVEVTVWD